ncbi:MAG TPA: Spy/CpxP family protein refolding chaperone [Alphaproteobacteria bacterium]|nr:Spy/CpxP family protein refolding chaperone [Alphaproteobacteria bacterium]
MGAPEMLYRVSSLLPGLAAMALGGILLAGAPATAAQEAGQKAASANPSDKSASKPVDRAEQRIKELHEKLHITQAQEPQWNSFVQVMRDNAEHMSSLIAQRDQNAGATAVDNLKSYEELTDAHAEGLKKLVPAFESLYASLSDDQKRVADTMFKGGHGKREKS